MSFLAYDNEAYLQSISKHRKTSSRVYILILASLLLFTKNSLAFLLPDTGETTCYNDDVAIPCPALGQPYYGQDANYRGREPAYRNNGDGTVTDLVTHLMWQQADDGVARTWNEAAAYCQGLTLGGHGDWRLPSRKEFLSIIDAGRAAPAINPAFTCSKSNSWYWTGTIKPDSTYAWYVQIVDGFSDLHCTTCPIQIRCVR